MVVTDVQTLLTHYHRDCSQEFYIIRVVEVKVSLLHSRGCFIALRSISFESILQLKAYRYVLNLCLVFVLVAGRYVV